MVALAVKLPEIVPVPVTEQLVIVVILCFAYGVPLIRHPVTSDLNPTPVTATVWFPAPTVGVRVRF